MEPLVRQFWGESVIPYAGTWDENVYYEDGLQQQLEFLDITTPKIRAELEKHRY